jgi:hypothetical protein
MPIVERIFPTYPQHARRRANEMREAEETLEFFGVHPHMAAAARAVIAAIADVNLPQSFPERGGDWPIFDVLGALNERRAIAVA